MTNPTQSLLSLLSRYAACADKLRGTGAPRLRPEIDLGGDHRLPSIDKLTSLDYEWVDVTIQDACVCWAMEVAGWYMDTFDSFADMRRHRESGGWYACVRLNENWLFAEGGFNTPAEAWCCVVEAICEGVGK